MINVGSRKPYISVQNLDTFDVAGFEFRKMGWNFQSQMRPQSPLVGVHPHTHGLGAAGVINPTKI